MKLGGEKVASKVIQQQSREKKQGVSRSKLPYFSCKQTNTPSARPPAGGKKEKTTDRYFRLSRNK